MAVRAGASETSEAGGDVAEGWADAFEDGAGIDADGDDQDHQGGQAGDFVPAEAADGGWASSAWSWSWAWRIVGIGCRGRRVRGWVRRGRGGA